MTEEDVIASRRRGNPRGRVLLDDTLLSLRAKRGNLGGAVTEKEVGIIE